jgi:hypothetical protein
MVVQLSQEVVVSSMRWLFRQATTSFSLLALSPPHHQKSYVALQTCGKLLQKVVHAGAKLVKL